MYLIVGEAMAAMAAKAIWKGSISFGLVNIPIQVFSATQKEAGLQYIKRVLSFEHKSEWLQEQQ
jgi:hypothetical protein